MTMQQNEKLLSGAAVDAIQKQVASIMDARIKQMQLRTWSVEMAIKVTEKCNAGDPMKLAEKIYDFVAQPDQPVTVKLAL